MEQRLLELVGKRILWQDLGHTALSDPIHEGVIAQASPNEKYALMREKGVEQWHDWFNIKILDILPDKRRGRQKGISNYDYQER